jgi:hypothetical protein
VKLLICSPNFISDFLRKAIDTSAYLPGGRGEGEPSEQ